MKLWSLWNETPLYAANRLFARVQLKKLPLEEASQELIITTDSLDIFFHIGMIPSKHLLEDNKEIHVGNQKLRQKIYGF